MQEDNMEKEGSAKDRALKRVQEHKRQMKLRFILTLIGVLSLGIILGWGIWGNKESKEGSAHLLSKDSALKSKHNLVGEEYPRDEKIGFGLEDLIEKSHKRDKKSKQKWVRRPELVIIIDDISHSSQLRKVRRLPFPVTPSIFPPSQMNAYSPKLARGLKHFMVHFPLESSSAKMNRFSKTLFVNDSAKKVRRRVLQIRRLFPTARFINNHTGSVFTSNYRAMYRLYGYLKEQGFIFLDSRTSAHSKVRKIAAQYRMPYLKRDVFLDNVQTPQAILKQLRLAIRIAKRRGYAIAIGHPHPVTLRVLKQSAPLLRGLRLLYIDEFYREHYGR